MKNTKIAKAHRESDLTITVVRRGRKLIDDGKLTPAGKKELAEK